MNSNKNNDLDNGDWSDRDSLPTGDPIGDVVEEEKVAKFEYTDFEKDQKKYLDSMKKNVINPNDKNFDLGGPCKGIDFIITEITIDRPKCDCGVAKSIKDATLKMHSDWCELRK